MWRIATSTDAGTVNPWIIEANTAYLSLAFRAAYKDRVNSNSMWGLGPRCIKLAKWDYTLQYYGACFAYFQNTLELAIDVDGWDKPVLDQGFRKKVGVDDDGNAIYETFVSSKDRGPLNHPRMLDGAGDTLPDGDPPEWLTPEVLEETDFSLLGFPDPLW